jgi:O-acetyl-ADP-ribose deacetylase (regulator of RNase III)
MKLILAAVDEPLATAWYRFCGDLELVQIHRGSILDVECDAIVSPANSFGFMDGGIDAIYRERFGQEIEVRARKLIAEKHHGELLVGGADMIETCDRRIPYMILAPTMRVPMVLRDTVNPYLAARAVFLLILHGKFDSGPSRDRPIAEKIQRVAFPGLGTGVGQLSSNVCARQMRVAIDEILLGHFTAPRTWAEASERHQLLYTDRLHRLQET